MKVRKKIKSTLVLFTLYFPAFLVAQINVLDSIAPLSYKIFTHKDTLYFFQKKGYYKLTESSKTFYPLNYIDQNAKDQPARYLDFISHKDSIYAIHPGGGITYKLSADSLYRIDRSRAHRNQFASKIFSYNDTLYNLGGYGLWSSKAILTYFNFTKKEWDVISTSGRAPKNGFSSGNHIIKNDILYTLGTHYIDTNTQKTVFIDQLLRFDLKSKTWLEPYTLDKNVYDLLYNQIKSPKDRLIKYKSKLILFPYSSDPYFYEFDLEKNQYLKAEFSEQFIVDEYYGLMYKDYILRLIKNPDTNLESLDLVVLPREFLQSEKLSLVKKTLSRDMILVGFLVIAAFSLIAIKLIGLRKKVRLLKRRLYYLGRSIPITNSEYYFLDLLFSTGVVDNKTLLDYFYKEGVTQDMIIKRKNAMIISLSSRIKQYFKTEFFTKAPDPKDKRQVVYILKKGLKLKSKE